MKSLKSLITLAAVALLALSGCGPEVPVFSRDGFPPDPPRPVPLNGRLLTSNNGDDTLTVVDLAERRVVGQLPVGFVPVELEGPHHLAADPTGAFVYVNLSEAVAGSGGGPHGAHGLGDIPGYALKLRASDGLMEGFARVDPNPGDNVLSADGSTLYVTHYDLLKFTQAVRTGDVRKADTRLAVIGTADMAVRKLVTLCPLAHGARISGDGTRLYASCATDEIAEVRLDDPALPVRRVLLPGATEGFRCTHCPYALSVAPDDTVWVSSLGADNGASGGGGLHVYDPARGAFDPAWTTGLCGRALFAAFARAPGSSDYRVYVPEQGPCGDNLRIYRPSAAGSPPELLATLPLPSSACLNAHMLRIHDDGRFAELICEGNHSGPGSLVFLDLDQRSVLGTLPLGVFPDGMALVPQRP